MQYSKFDDFKNSPHWYALYTRPRFEKKVDLNLREKGLESFLPLRKVQRRWSDRVKMVEEPLFSGYVFVRIPLKNRFQALQTDGVIRMVSFNGTPSPIPDAEINAVKKVLKHPDTFELTSYDFTIGQTVEVMRGPFSGIRGHLIEKRGKKKLIIGIEQIRQALLVEIDERDVRPLVSKI